MRGCAVPSCKSRGKTPGISFHEFPASTQIHEQWIQNISTADRNGSVMRLRKNGRSSVCSLHFEPNCFLETLKLRRLNKLAVPTVFDYFPSHLNKKSCVKEKSPSLNPMTSPKKSKPKANETELTLESDGRGKKSSKNIFKLNMPRLETKEFIGNEVCIKSEFVANDEDSYHDRDPIRIEGVQMLKTNGLLGEVKTENQDNDDMTSSLPISVHVGHIVFVDDIKKEVEPEVERAEEEDPLRLDLDLISDSVSHNAGVKCEGNPRARIPNTHTHKRILNMNGHEGVENFKCNICRKYLPTSRELIDHNVVHTQETKYNCRNGGKSFVYKRNLKRHLREYHERETPPTGTVKCETCGKIFKDQSDWKKHVMTHTIEKSHECDTCGYRTRRMSNLNQHKKNKHNIKKLGFECEACGKTFKSVHSLRVHISRNEGKKLLNCVFCGKTFHNLSDLNVHKRDEHKDMRQINSSEKSMFK